MLSWMRSHGFKRGSLKVGKNQWAMTQENGMELINSPTLGMLTPISKGSTIFNAEQTKALWEMSKNYIDQFSKVPGRAGMNVGQITNNNSIQISIDHVQDYADFVRQAQADPKFERLIKSMSTDQLNGKPSVSKKRINF